MDTTSPLFEKLDECIGFVDIAGRQVETILRGGSISEAEQSQIIQKAHQTFSFLHQNLHSFHSENNRNYYLEIGVKLHNKCRNLVSPNYVEIRALLRAISGLIILAFGDRTAKVFAICIKLLSKSGEEFIRENESRANDCFSICISLWNSAKEETLAIFEQLPPLEIQELKIYIAKCFVGKLTMLTKHFVDNEETTSIIMAALDIIQTLQLSYKFTIIEKLLGISNSYSQLSSKETAINLMHLCLDTLQLHPPTNKPEQSDPSANNENEIEKYIELKMRCCLALSYLYSELK